MLERILIAGSGGQGVILAGRLLATVAMRHCAHVTFFPSYGAEVRGGVSNCQLVLSSDEIASPVCEVFDSLILMRHPDAPQYLAWRAPNGLALMDRADPSAQEGVVGLDATGLADALGDVRAANLVMLGRWLALKPVAPIADVETEVRRFFAARDPTLADRNVRALRAGHEAR